MDVGDFLCRKMHIHVVIILRSWRFDMTEEKLDTMIREVIIEQIKP